MGANKVIIVVALLLAVTMSYADVSSSFVCLDGKWDFAFTPSSSSEIPTLPSDDQFDIQLEIPGFWNTQKESLKEASWYAGKEFKDDIPRLFGNGWCRKTVHSPNEWKGKVVNLNVNRAIGQLHVWVNGEHVGSYDYGFYTPYQFDISSYLKYGCDNEIIISSDNNKIGAFKGAWCFFAPYYIAGGISDSVYLDVSAGKGYVADLFIQPGSDLKEILWQVELENGNGATEIQDSTIFWEVWDKDKKKRIACGYTSATPDEGSKYCTWKVRVDKLEPWSVNSPNLYWAKIMWKDKCNNVIDDIEQMFGLRRLSYQGRKLFLNGEPIYLRGQFGAYYHPIHGGIPTSKEYWLENMRIAKGMGMNYLNFAAQVCPVEMMEAADEIGMILQCGDHITVLKENRDYYMDVWPEIIKLTRRYPSMCIYGFGGERSYYDGILDQYKKQYDLIKELNPSAFVMPQQAIRGIDYAFDEQGSKELTQEPFPHHAERLAQYTQACDMFGHYSCTAFSYSFDEAPLWQDMDKRFEIYDRPISAHELFIASSYLNPDNMSKYTECFPATLYENTEKQLKEAGMLDKWKTYARNSEMLQGICIKYNLEKVRKCDNMVAFEFLGMSDLHVFPPKTFSVGILDEFLQYKQGVSPEYILQSNDDTVLLIDYDGGDSINRAYWENDVFKADVMLSHYSKEDIKNAKLTWQLSEGKKVVLKGSTKINEFKSGFSKKISELKIKWPTVKATTRMNLCLSLKFGPKTVVNNWNFWVFPKLDVPTVNAKVDEQAAKLLGQRYITINADDAKLYVVRYLDAQKIDAIESGSDVLLPGTERFSVNNKYTKFRPGLGARTHHNVGKVIYDHPVFANLDNDGWGNWQFFYIFNNAPNVIFDDIEKELGMKFAPIIEVISPAEEIRKQAMMFEYKVGKGRLFVAGNVFSMNNAACVTLLDSVLSYVQSDKFKPKTEIPAESLRKMLGSDGKDGQVASQLIQSQVSGDKQYMADVKWSKSPVKVGLEPNEVCRLNGGKWMGIWVLEVAGEGVNKVEIKNRGSDAIHKVKMIGIDFTAPTMEFVCVPAIDQLGGVYIASAETKYALKSVDNLSGVKLVEYSTDDGQTYQPYQKPFELKSGNYKLRFRTTDNAGNQTDIVFGQDLTGGKTNQVALEVK